ncbi:MAG: MBL fold metallo-hydrolase [Desulfobacteraceae bacterium]|nr:MBL fold metallo-hydrolase [Desulfobacteraceae bacterium]
MKPLDRRKFLSKMLTGMKALPVMGLLPPSVLSAAIDQATDKTLHYRPLNGDLLTDIVKRKLHHGPDRFENPLGLSRDGRFGELLEWKFFSFNKFSSHLDEQPVIPLTVNWDAVKDHSGLSVTYLKHAGLFIKDHDRHIIVDPIFEDIFWFIEDFSPLAFDVQKMPQPDDILITHGHYDHLDMSSLSLFKKDAHVISPLGYNLEFKELGLDNRTQLDWFGAHTANQQEILLLPCNHWTMRSPIEGPNTSLWGSYIIRSKSGYTIYVSGDTAYFDGFEQIGNAFNIDLAIINLGAYEPRWFMAPSHMNPEETVRAFVELKAKKIMIVHWGTFRLGDEPVHFPPMQIRKALAKEGLEDRLVDLKQGETYFIN